MIRRRAVSSRINQLNAYQKINIEGIIIYIDEVDGWCNVELTNGTILYRIYFGEGVHPRLKRLEQAVTLTQVIGARYNYIITGAGKRYIDSDIFQDKGVTVWDKTPVNAQWNKRYQWK